GLHTHRMRSQRMIPLGTTDPHNWLERKLTNLRREITREVLRIMPELEQDSKLTDGKLLEIHAVDLYQSAGVYRKIKKLKPDFYHQQHEWLRQTLEYSAGYGVQYFTHMITRRQRTYSRRNLNHFAESACTYLKHDSVKKRLHSMAKNPYFTALPIILSELDDFLTTYDGISQIFCHTNDDTKSFSTISTYSIAQVRGHYTRLKQPVSRTCSEEQIIQSADTAGYVILQILYSRTFDTPFKPEFKTWFEKYIQASMKLEPHNPSTEKQHSISIMVLEMLLSNTGGPNSFQTAVKNTLPSAIECFLANDPSPIFLTEAGVVLGHPKMNTPPSGDEEVYDASVYQPPYEWMSN
ncbi:hypothetical protein ACI3L1_17360, partial [Deinococcus sp. SM5_A1]|uniref:hypothetical protein n=1 Tax=Deinococcus sp. SM5_A1 TaxID=3379094 RepID=UPI00385A5F04